MTSRLKSGGSPQRNRATTTQINHRGTGKKVKPGKPQIHKVQFTLGPKLPEVRSGVKGPDAGAKPLGSDSQLQGGGRTGNQGDKFIEQGPVRPGQTGGVGAGGGRGGAADDPGEGYAPGQMTPPLRTPDSLDKLNDKPYSFMLLNDKIYNASRQFQIDDPSKKNVTLMNGQVVSLSDMPSEDDPPELKDLRKTIRSNEEYYNYWYWKTYNADPKVPFVDFKKIWDKVTTGVRNAGTTTKEKEYKPPPIFFNKLKGTDAIKNSPLDLSVDAFVKTLKSWGSKIFDPPKDWPSPSDDEQLINSQR